VVAKALRAKSRIRVATPPGWKNRTEPPLSHAAPARRGTALRFREPTWRFQAVAGFAIDMSEGQPPPNSPKASP
jgi:hypothetical protein